MTTATQELKHRATAKRKELEARLENLKADAVGAKNDAVDSLKKKIHQIDEAAREGWDNLSDATARKMNELLK